MMSKRTVAPDTAEQRIGPELKRLREAAGLSLRTLADRAGFSPSFISQVENAQVSPSIASLEKIAATLNVSLADFFTTPSAPDVLVVRADERPSFRSTWSRARIDALTPAGKGRSLEAIMVTIEGGGSSGKHATGLPSDQLAVVFSGALSLTVADNLVELDAGDAVLVPHGTPHRWQNAGSAAAQVLLVSPRPIR